MPEPIEDYELLNAEPLDFDLFLDLIALTRELVEKSRPLKVSQELHWTTILKECVRRFPDDEQFLQARRFLVRFGAMRHAMETGVVADWYVPDDSGEDVLHTSAVLASACCPLQPDGNFAPAEYLRTIGEVQDLVREEFRSEA